MNKKINIGRDYACDIKVDDRYEGVSRNHAAVFSENGRVIFEDSSTNGSYINGVKIHRARKELHSGDVIYLGKQYLLSWGDINRHLGISSFSRATVKLSTDNGIPANKPVQQFQAVSSPPPGAINPEGNGIVSQAEIDRELSKWNWGAFFFSWIWAICNGIYWPLVVLIPYIGWMSALIINVILGVKGSAWAWKAKSWSSLDDFKTTQKKWSMWALYIFLGTIALGVLSGLIAGILIAGF